MNGLTPQRRAAVQIVIEKNVPAPANPRRRKYPFAEMEVGDSFFAPNIKISSVTYSFARHPGKKFTARTVTENGVKGFRVWRIA